MSNKPSDILSKPLEQCKIFEEISEWREASFKIQQNSGDNLTGILSDIYSEPTHFIFELLQNADDAMATKVRFEISNDKIVFYHNGTREFSLQDIIAITGIGNSTKTGTENSIGKFGVGFKAVFAITKIPKIWSKTYSFNIKNLTVPYEIESTELGEWTTIFELEFASDKYSKDEIRQRVTEEAGILDIQTILFLRHIRDLEVVADKSRAITLEHEQRDGYTEFFDPIDESKYLVFYGGINNRTSIAYRIDTDGSIIKPRNANVSVYFPTQVKSHLGFVVNAPFSTPRTRETIDFRSSYNPELVNEVKVTFRSSIIKLRDLGLWTSDLIQNIMPINSELCEESQIYDYLYDDIADAFKKEKLVPIKGSRYALADMIIIASDNSIVRLMKNKKWADISSSHALLRSFYANELGIQTVNFENFIELCTINYLKERKTSWLYQFYAYCSDRLNNDYRDINKNFLKQQSIIKSRTGNFVSAYVGESQNIFLNSKGLSNARIVDNIFTTKAKGVPQETRYKLENLLEKLEIKSRSPKSTIELDIMRKWEKSDFKMRKKLFFDIVDIYNVSNKDEKDEIAKYLSDKNVLYATSGEWFSDNVYQDTANLHLLFDSVNKVGYIHADFWVVDYKEREITQKDGVKKLVKECCGSNELLEALGVIKGLRVRREESGTYWRFYQPDDSVLLILKEYDVHKEVALSIDYTYEIDNFDEILKNIDTPKKSRALVDELLAISDDKYSGSVNWYSSYQAYKPKGKYVIPAQFILDLSKEKWIFDKDGRPKAPNEVFEEDFRELYEIKKAEKLPEWIDFKPSVVKSLPPDDQEKLKLVASYTPEQLKIILDSGDTVKDLENEPEISLEDRTRDIVLDENRDIEESEADSSHSEVLFNEEVHEFSVNKPAVRERKEKETTKKTDNSKKMLGDYAEGKVMELLKRDHPNATDIPGGFISVDKKFLLIGDNNPGYDIEVSKGDEIIEYIEVKSRTAESSSVVITYTEWEYAKKYAAKYTIYVVDVVSDISDEETPLHSHKYRDPYKQYKEGIISVIPDSYRLD